MTDHVAFTPRDAPLRFSSKVAVSESGCWVWTAGRQENGYGRFWIDGRNDLAHRYAFRTFVGPIPEGLQIDHLCRNTLCVNPAHLEAVTGQVNTLRGFTLARENASKTHCKHGHPFDVENTCWSTKQRICRTCKRIEGRRRRAALRSAQ